MAIKGYPSFESALDSSDDVYGLPSTPEEAATFATAQSELNQEPTTLGPFDDIEGRRIWAYDDHFNYAMRDGASNDPILSEFGEINGTVYSAKYFMDQNQDPEDPHENGDNGDNGEGGGGGDG